MLIYLAILAALWTNASIAIRQFVEAPSRFEHAPAILDRWRPWLALAAMLIAIAYGPTLIRLAATTPFNAPGLRVW